MVKPVNDLRVKKTLLSINKAFLEMITEHGLEHITVKELCEKAMINKKTFYSHYSSIDDLLFSLQVDIASEFWQKIEKYNVPDDLPKINEEFFKYFASKGKLYDKIICSTSPLMAKGVMDKLIQRSWEEYFKKTFIQEDKKRILLHFLNLIGFNFYRQWVFEGKKVPLDKIIELTNSLFCEGVFGFLDRCTKIQS